MTANASHVPASLETAARSDTTAVLLCSSDNTFDVGVQIAAALDRQWSDCPYPRFVLTTSTVRPWPLADWSRIISGEPLGWQEELRLGLLALPAHVRHVLLVLDDFLFLSRVDTDRVRELVGEAERHGLAYLRLKPVDRSLAVRLMRRLRTRPGIVALDGAEPYYASLQLAIWRRDHLLALLSRPGSIWDFERRRDLTETHYALTRTGPIRYLHVVEKGKWLPYAARAFQTAGIAFEPGKRPVLDRRYAVLHVLRKTRFAVFGYSLMRLKTRISTRSAGQ